MLIFKYIGPTCKAPKSIYLQPFAPEPDSMKRNIINAAIFLKQFTLLLRPHIFLGWLRHPLLTISNTLSMTRWIAQQNKKDILNDFYSPRRNYDKRLQLFDHICDKFNLPAQPIDYLEFGVASGHSFRWWISKCTHTDSKFYGFDTFEGLPENWGAFKKGDMIAGVPVLDDQRAKFLKGLFQDSLPAFLKETNLNNDRKKVIHLDADLFSSTLFALTSLAPYLKSGDMLLFDEFNVPNHEYYAFRIFTESYYVKITLVAAVNNFYQVAMAID